jgi:hypothetical protein
LSGASRPLLLSWRPGVNFFFQIGINEFCKFIAEHLQVGLRIRRAVMLHSIYVQGVEGLKAVDRDSLRALPCPTVVGTDFLHQFVQLTFDLPRSGPGQCELPGLTRPESGHPQPHRLGRLVGLSVLVIRLALLVYRAAHILA